jgi:hypothetical protein
MIWVLILHPWLKQSAKDGTNNWHIDDNRHISRVIKVWSCTYLIIFLMIVEVLIAYLIFLWWSKFNHVYFIFWQSSKCNHVFYISMIIEVWSCILYFDSCWSLIMLSYIFLWLLRFRSRILYFDGCWSLIMNFNISTQLLKFGQSYNFLCILHTPLQQDLCVFLFPL